ncbi:S26 family signal peptidase [Kiloniella laminariae]|uniref:S26 family signal peptidase n=1 Tax=Kiloniella laminariae TaxID=454162 RepID=A0ABT4LLI5_9PROT|nr:S26 family signal peptidase [Kiloniella laminariae]MCZ4281966.1 S26 family signal peptidase [Kiloniella laminariae]
MTVASSSMAPNIFSGERIFLYKTTPELGDILAFKGKPGFTYAKRLVAVDGDEICFNIVDFIRNGNPEKTHLGEFENSSVTFKMYQESADQHFLLYDIRTSVRTKYELL